MKMSVIGTGYLGATHAAAMAELGHEVVGVDVDDAKIARLQQGDVPFFEPGLPELLRKHVESGALRFTTSMAEAARDRRVALRLRRDAAEEGRVRRRPDLRGRRGHVARRAPAAGRRSSSASRPSRRARPRASRRSSRRPAASWCGTRSSCARALPCRTPCIRTASCSASRATRAARRWSEAYAPILADGRRRCVVTDYATAELVKVAANSFLATKISFINAMAEVCEVTGADVVQLSEAIGHDERIGHRFLHAGLGFGGGCLPKDIRAFMARAGELGVDQALSFLKSVDEINLRRRARMVDLAREVCDGTFAGQRVGVLGAAFKPNSDDIRDSPALDVALTIQRAGAAVRVYDPQAMGNAKDDYPTLAYADSAFEACRDADVVLHLTEWQEFREMSPVEFAKVVRRRNIVDGRNALDPEVWRAADWTFRALGRQ